MKIFKSLESEDNPQMEKSRKDKMQRLTLADMIPRLAEREIRLFREVL